MPIVTMLINTNANALVADHLKAIFEIEIQVEGKVTHLRSFVEGWKASEKQVEEVERQVEDNLEGIRKATIAQMRVITFMLLYKIHIKFRVEIDILKLMRCLQNQKASQAQSNSKQEQISTQVLKLKLLLATVKVFSSSTHTTGGICGGNCEGIGSGVEERDGQERD